MNERAIILILTRQQLSILRLYHAEPHYFVDLRLSLIQDFVIGKFFWCHGNGAVHPNVQYVLDFLWKLFAHAILDLLVGTNFFILIL